MNVVPFIAENAADAVKQIRARFGPEAVVLNVRKLPASGLSRLWNKPRIEVLACASEPEAGQPSEQTTAPNNTTPLLDVREPDDAVSLPLAPSAAEPAHSRKAKKYSMPNSRGGEWHSASLLQTMGLSSLNTERVMEQLRQQNGGAAPSSLRVELALLRSTMRGFWKDALKLRSGLHVFVGTPGSGKTTAICKWMTQAVLIEGEKARAWRLDMPRANLAEALSVHAEILNVPVERAWNPGATWPEKHLFVDLPGVEANDTTALAKLERLLSTMPGATVSLVLNAAYDLPLLQAQVRSFARLPITDLLFTHLDEEPRGSKLWNFVLGTNYSLSFLGAGQNIPGQFLRASPESLFPTEIRTP